MQIDLLLQMMQLQMMSSATGACENREQDSSLDSGFALVLASVLAAAGSGSGGASLMPSYMPGVLRTYGSGSTYPAVSVAKQQHNRPEGEVVYPAEAGIDAMISRVSEKYDLDPALLKAVVKVESGFNPRAVSNAGAMGLMQLMPETAASLGVKNPFNSSENLEAGTRYLKSMLDRYSGNVDLALAAYNAGPGAVQKHGGIPPYRETLAYLQRVNQSRLEYTV